MSYVEKVATVFRECPGIWIDSWELMRIGGGMAWRTRVSDCRKLGMVIENRVRKKANGVKVSEYRFVPENHNASLAAGAAAGSSDAPIESL